ncbi:hypothetical protein CWE15_03640 [Aliidiomarina taiwanensis]|uniref:DUF6868 domain-containing protein n=1 Tax=Aliidiomarina taiwanensis TaxID=946228 RepID=A0A432XA42_9GAMM|nr:hypothetical protein [Aliidiomarina taiwanensis]RUO44273.1 hypothetical protein CWE15_03640 [Aliidiomarina taiwanensis]
MFTLPHLISLLGWCSLINIAILLLAFLMVTTLRETVMGIHSKLTGVSKEHLPVLYFQYLGQYKLLIVVFNLVPYLALKLI